MKANVVNANTTIVAAITDDIATVPKQKWK